MTSVDQEHDAGRREGHETSGRPDRPHVSAGREQKRSDPTPVGPDDRQRIVDATRSQPSGMVESGRGILTLAGMFARLIVGAVGQGKSPCPTRVSVDRSRRQD
jgi:hypothetical protein